MKLYCIIALSLLLRPETATAQQEESITLSLQQAIEIAQENSPEAQAARHTYRAAYWNYRFSRAPPRAPCRRRTPVSVRTACTPDNCKAC